MDCVSDQFLARPRLSLNQHSSINRGNFRHGPEDGLELRTDSDYFIESITARQFVAKFLDFTRQFAHIERPIDEQQEFVVIEWFGKIIKCAGFHRLDSRTNGAVSGHYYAIGLVVITK